MRLKYNCEYCGYSEIRHFRKQVIGEPYIAGRGGRQTVSFHCPRCGVTQWNINQRYTIVERLYLAFYQQITDSLGKLGLKQYVFDKGESVDEWINSQETGELDLKTDLKK